MSRLRWALAAGTLVVLGVGVVTLVGDDDGGLPDAPLLPTTTRPDLSGVTIGSVEGTTTSTEVSQEGEVSFSGVVRTGEGRPVSGATVRAEWFRVEPPVVIEVRTDDQGGYEISGVAPGRWRLRAWAAPRFASTDALDLFVESEEQRELDLEVTEVPELEVTWDVEPDPPITDHNAQLVVHVFEQTVDVDGRAGVVPLVGSEVTLVTADEWVHVRGDRTGTTDVEGRVDWVLRCTEDGRHRVGVRTPLGRRDLEVAACIPVTATTTTTTAPSPEGEEAGDEEAGDEGGGGGG